VNLGFVLGVCRARGALRRHERSSRAEIEAHQAAGVADLRRFALERSPFYRRFHAGAETQPLSEVYAETEPAGIGAGGRPVTIHPNVFHREKTAAGKAPFIMRASA